MLQVNDLHPGSTHRRLVLGDPWDFDCAVSLCLFLRSLILTPASSAWVSACAATFCGPSVVLTVVACVSCMHTSILSRVWRGIMGCCRFNPELHVALVLSKSIAALHVPLHSRQVSRFSRRRVRSLAVSMSYICNTTRSRGDRTTHAGGSGRPPALNRRRVGRTDTCRTAGLAPNRQRGRERPRPARITSRSNSKNNSLVCYYSYYSEPKIL